MITADFRGKTNFLTIVTTPMPDIRVKHSRRELSVLALAADINQTIYTHIGLLE